uniref:Uncharacterized protein n=1 Tax=Sphingobacterium sp. (strain 21) TaxID=743722 RepID=F4CDX2_SPHS2
MPKSLLRDDMILELNDKDSVKPNCFENPQLTENFIKFLFLMEL